MEKTKATSRLMMDDTMAMEYFKDNFYLSPIAITVIDLKGQCIIGNQAFLRLFFGETANVESVRTLQIKSIFEEEEVFETLIEDIKARDVLRRREARLRDGDGNRLDMLLAGRMVQYPREETIELSMMDISKQKRLQRRLQYQFTRLESLIESMNVGLFLVDDQGLIREVNQQIGEVLSIESAQLTARNYLEFFSQLISSAKEPEVLQQGLERAVIAVNERPSVELALKGDFPRYFEISFFPVWNERGSLNGWGGMIQDVTETRERLGWKLELLSVLSHDLRAPLATLKGQTTALSANFRRWGGEMIQDFLVNINRSTDKLIHQVERSLALTRVESGSLGLLPEACEISEIIDQSLEVLAGSRESPEVILELPGNLPNVRCDPARVEEVIINLLENAFRFSPEDQSIRIEAQSMEPMLEISITDRGPGVPPEKQGAIFDKYSRAEHETEGSGLGLFISRKIVEAHGGRIWVESPPEGRDHGARFTFTLPIVSIETKPREPTPAVRKSAPEKTEQDLRVLVVDDEPDFQALLRTILTDEGYQVEVAPDGSTAIDIVHTSPPDIILLDWMMPGMSGLSTCRNIRRWTNTPILMVTSRTAQDDLVAALDAGADDYVTKPFQTPELLARIEALSRRRQTLQEEEPDRVTVGGLSINFETYEVWRGGERLELTPTEFELLAYLVRNRGQVLTYEQLMDHLYGMEEDRDRHDLFVHVSRLRKKIEPDPDEPRYIRTKWGVGYILETN